MVINYNESTDFIAGFKFTYNADSKVFLTNSTISHNKGKNLI